MAGRCLGLLVAIMRAKMSKCALNRHADVGAFTHFRSGQRSGNALSMTLLRICLVCTCSLLLSGVSPALGQSEREALIAAFNSEMKALNTGDLDAAVATAHEGIVLYGLYSPFPIEGKEAFRQAVQEYFDEHESAVLEIVYPKYRITRATGVAWGNYQLTTQIKGERTSTTPGQYMLTYAQVDGAWMIISMHFAPLP